MVAWTWEWEQELTVHEYMSSYRDDIKIPKINYANSYITLYNLVKLLTTTELYFKMGEFYDI